MSLLSTLAPGHIPHTSDTLTCTYLRAGKSGEAQRSPGRLHQLLTLTSSQQHIEAVQAMLWRAANVLYPCRAGEAAGLREGKQLGLSKGLEIGLEVGFIGGCVQAGHSL